MSLLIFLSLRACRCESLNSPKHRPYFCDPSFLPSPCKSYRLPSYAEAIANQLVDGMYRACRPAAVSSRGLEFLDTEAIESDTGMSSHSMGTDFDDLSDSGFST